MTSGISYLTLMSIKPIILIPDPILRIESKPVEQVDDQLRAFLDDMLETMYDAPGIGLAAIQLGEPLRVITMDVSSRAEPDEDIDDEQSDVEPQEPEKNPIFMINPEIVWMSETASTYEEGCLSIPEYYAEVERPESCHVQFLDRDGKRQELEASGLMSTCIQHEVDHLNGVLFVDHISKLKRDMVIKKFTKTAKQNGRKFIG